MRETRRQKFLKQQQYRRIDQLKRLNKKINRTIVTMGTTSVVGLYSSPITAVLTAKANLVEAATPASQFLSSIIPAAQRVAKGNDIYTSVMIAQAALESGWGTSHLAKEPNHNLFGVKGAYQGESVTMPTLEDDGTGNYYTIQANFRKYPSYQESLEDYVDKMVHGITGAPLFYAGTWKSNTSSYKDATAYLTGRYATDTAYGSKLNQIIEQYQLTQYDQLEEMSTIPHQNKTESVVVPQNSRNEGNESSSSLSSNRYVIQKGDTLYSISKRNGIHLKDLYAMNQLHEESVIYPGQQLALPSSELPVEETTSNPKQDSSITYTIQKGDTLYRISRKNNISLSELVALNHLDEQSVIYPGQTLVLPDSKLAFEDKLVASTQSIEKTSEASSAQWHTVQAGDTLYRIARQNGIALSTLLDWNQLTVHSIIYPGQTLKISESESGSNTVSTTLNADDQLMNDAAITYTVKPGDGLWRIAKNHGLTLETLKEINHLTSTIIHPGQVLIISR